MDIGYKISRKRSPQQLDHKTMEKLTQTAQKWNVREVLITTFVVTGICSFLVVMLAPYMLTEEQAARHYSQDPEGIRELIFAFGVPIAASVIAAISMACWKARTRLTRQSTSATT